MTTSTRTALSGFMLLLILGSAMASTGAPAVPVTAARIALKNEVTRELLLGALFYAAETTAGLNVAYGELDAHIRTGDLSTAALTQMEATHYAVSARHDSLRTVLGFTKTSAEELFGMMRQRAEENENDELREIMERGIKERETAFEAELQTANVAMEGLAASIQRHDDILGFLQVSTALDEADRFLGDVQRVTAEARTLDAQLRSSIEDGYEIIEAMNSPDA